MSKELLECSCTLHPLHNEHCNSNIYELAFSRYFSLIFGQVTNISGASPFNRHASNFRVNFTCNWTLCYALPRPYIAYCIYAMECYDMIAEYAIQCYAGTQCNWVLCSVNCFASSCSPWLQLIGYVLVLLFLSILLIMWGMKLACNHYVEVSRNAHNGETNAKKLITRPIMTVTSPNSPHIALTYTKMRFDNFFDHTYPPSWS